MGPARLVLIDNYDSYTHNLAHLVAMANKEAPTVIPADAYPNLSALTDALGSFDGYILSPGPGSPLNDSDFPRLERDVLAASAPVLGVCLGHQALCAAYGTGVARAPAGPVHGAVVSVTRAPAGHDCPLLTGLPSVFDAVRYHSLAATLPLNAVLLPTAWTTDVDEDGVLHQVLMSVRHRAKPLFGVQYHPESISSEHGLRLVANFVKIVHAFHGCARIERPLPQVVAPPSAMVDRPAKYRTLIQQVRYLTVDSADVFVRLFSNEPGAFWLDSSSASSLGSDVSCCSSPGPSPDSPLDSMSDDDTDGAKQSARRSDTMKGRYSIMGACIGPLSEIVLYNVKERCVTVTDSSGASNTLQDTTIFDYFKSTLTARYAPQHPDLPVEMNGGYVGYFGYEVKADVEGIKGNQHESNLPDAWFTFGDRVLIVDHEEGSLYLVAVIRDESREDLSNAKRWFGEITNVIERMDKQVSRNGIGKLFDAQVRREGSKSQWPALQFTPERSKTSYLDDIRRCLLEIRNGESYEICLTTRLRAAFPEKCDIDPVQIYCALRLVNPAPYAAFLRLSPKVAVCCSSPERYLQISSTGVVTSKPIKGTLPRGRSLHEDEALRALLQSSEKDRRENLMIVDLVRNDLSRTCVVGSVQVPQLMHVESYATVHQLVSTITGVLARPGEAVNCIRAAYPMGSMTGAPKVRTMEIIDRLEHSARGIYSGSIGYLSLCGATDLNVVIRTAVVKGRQVEIGVGGAIVALSNPEDEYDELMLKGKAIMQSLAMQTTGRSEFVVVHEHNDKSDETNLFVEEPVTS